MYIQDTIAAISTPPGYGGISIIRISGPDAFSVTEKLFRRPNGASFADQEIGTIKYGHIVNQNGEILDEVLVSKMKAPHTFTAEDVAEINCHGGMAAVKNVLDEILRIGARPADPGEFTKRAFLNGRIDLSQAEAISDVIYAKTTLSSKTALSQLSGVLSDEINTIKETILKLLADLEVTIQYPEYDVPDVTEQELLDSLHVIKEKVIALIDSYQQGSILKEGIKIAIAGKPNVGKSMLLNRLIRENKAIVTDIPGTTRDTVDAYINIKGIPAKIIDTAGIRESEDLVESIGIQRSKEMIALADVVLFVADASTPLEATDRKIFEEVRSTTDHYLVVLNKTDVGTADETLLYFKDEDVLAVSALTKDGLHLLEQALERYAHTKGEDVTSGAMITNARHYHLLRTAETHIEEAISAVKNGIPLDLTETDIRDAWHALGSITGETLSEDIIDEIFANFCLGK